MDYENEMGSHPLYFKDDLFPPAIDLGTEFENEDEVVVVRSNGSKVVFLDINDLDLSCF